MRFLRTALPALALAAAFSACRGHDAAPVADSSLAQDLAMAQRAEPGPLVFNDAPATSAAAPSARGAAPKPVRRQAPTSSSVPMRVSVSTPVPRHQSTTKAPIPASRPEPAPADGGSEGTAGVIGAGTRIGMTTNGRVCAATALAGDKFTATVTEATTGSNGAVIPAGSTVVLEVASVDRTDPIEASRINFRVRAIDVDGVARPADGDVATLGSLQPVQTASGDERTKVIGGAVAGAVLGRIFGHSTKATVIGAATGAAAGTVAARRSVTTDACLPNGSPLRLTLSRDLAVRRAGAI